MSQTCYQIKKDLFLLVKKEIKLNYCTNKCCPTTVKYVYAFNSNLSFLSQVLSYKSLFLDTPQSH